jgi:hypothetical protein
MSKAMSETMSKAMKDVPYEVDEALSLPAIPPDGSQLPLEVLEELRLTLRSFLRPSLLKALLEVRKLLDKEPQYTKQYHWFVHHGQWGKECRFALEAARRFKEERLDKLETLLRRSLEEIQRIREES